MHRKHLQTVFALGVSLLFLYLAARRISPDEFLGAFAQVSPWSFFPALACYFLSFLFRTWRWRYILTEARGVPARRLFVYLTIGYMANNLLPARLGELVRAYVTGIREKISGSGAFASIVLERLFDGLTIVVILLLLLIFAGMDQPWLQTLAWVSGTLLAAAVGVLVLWSRRRARALALIHGIFKVLPAALARPCERLFDRFGAGLDLLTSPKRLVYSFLLSFCVWGAELGVYLVYLDAFGIEVPIQAGLLALVVVNLSGLIPSSPGLIGVFQYACQQSLAVFAVGEGTALAFSVAVHATQVVPITLLGLVFLAGMGLSLRGLAHLPRGNARET